MSSKRYTSTRTRELLRKGSVDILTLSSEDYSVTRQILDRRRSTRPWRLHLVSRRAVRRALASGRFYRSTQGALDIGIIREDA